MTDDAVSHAFEEMRKAAKRRGKNVPDLRRQNYKALSDAQPNGAEATVPGVEIPSLSRRRFRRGRPTGPDGRAKRRPLDVPRMGTVVGKEIAQRGWQHELAHGWVSGHWETLVGEQIAQHTTVEMIKEGKVFVTCTSTAWATNLKYMQSTILSEIAKKIGPGVITELKIFGPKAPSWRKGPLHVKGRGPRDTYG
ncbi:hypothetical protein C3B44_00025 [Corynebacterium yudongzhengii]|uniref:DUF721 domain-containing protein n=1 Tax=Corynebacterium yudongzhengii TaxID=2080740 RepID=A0A2U1T570_9CORY|nr:DciA family protein [Corynebacterium yudongzhengii]AWB80934.1 hypothetical protein C3B44_00025 [Corynebacterium yudongzhengii]PWC01140.1 DUF721 domain-containing protein [Corynebacterium yudongzhengii]